ncbi:MAG TPA: chromosomal replication initiator protein DnaA [Phycisphaerae bacterium]|nr:chromosomal replication initiator protein DnaA [Phycisphaerae bacterium]
MRNRHMGIVSPRLWNDILVALRTQNPALARAWLVSVEPVAMANGVIRVQPATEAQHHYLTSQCQSAFNQAAQAATGRLVTVEFLSPRQKGIAESRLSFEEEEEAPLNSDYTFGNFVTGPCNRLAHAASVAVADSPGHVYNPLFVHGSAGLGKTHLLQAVCHQLHATGHEKILYLSCETFTNHFVEAIERGALHQFRFRYRHVDALIIDDIQFLTTREGSREEFFHTFNTLYQAHKQIILSGDEAPSGMPTLEDRLVSRFNWGLVARIDSPCLETRMAIVRKKAALRCADVPEDVVHLIAATIQSNTRELEGALTKVLAMSQQLGGILDLELARKALGDHMPGPARQLGITDIVETVTEWFNVRLADLQGKRRNRSIALPRQVCMYLARELTSLSLEEVGGYFGGRDHTTVLHAARTIADQRGSDPELQHTLQELNDRLRRRLS